MHFFPQLESGCVAQYPVVKRLKARTVVNQLADGSRFVFADDRAREVEWDLLYSGLRASEVESITQLFQDCEGSLGRFLFIDPAGNALRFSEDLNQSPWSIDPGLTLTCGVTGPSGGQSATQVVNGTALAQGLRQTIVAPGLYTYCFSGYFRSTEPGRIQFGWTTGGESVWGEGVVDPVWRRLHCTGALSGGPASIVFQIGFPAGLAVDVCGLQVEAQREPSGYQKTTNLGGVYANARFVDDVLSVTCEGADDYTIRVRVGAPMRVET